MKVALIKLGSRISISSSGTSGGTGEALSIIKMLNIAGVEVDAYTKVLDKDEKPSYFNIYNIEDSYKNIDGYDSLIVLNGNVNYFGGLDDPSQTLNYYIINHFNGPVYYIMCDCNLLLKQIWPSIEKKKWASNYSREDIFITRKDIKYVSQAMFTHKVKEKACKQGIDIEDVIYYPTEKFPLITLEDLDFNDYPEYDLLYGGTFRGGKREDDMIKYYFGHSKEFKVGMFGNISYDNFKKEKVQNLSAPVFEKSVSYSEFSNKMRESAATVIIGDPLYKSWGNLAQRIYESIRVGNVVLIDSNYDFTKRVFSSKDLQEFNYVSSRFDVEDRLRKIRDSSFRKDLLTSQRECTIINKYKYCSDFASIIGGK